MTEFAHHDRSGDGGSAPPGGGSRAVWRLALLLAASLASLGGCGGRQQSPPATGSSTAMETETGATAPISLTWDQQNSCVVFNPPETRIHIGDRVNFTSSLSETVTVHVPAGLFSAGDTTLVVVRGPGTTSPVALALGTYALTSDPTACSSTMGGGGPSIIVDTGGTGPRQ